MRVKKQKKIYYVLFYKCKFAWHLPLFMNYERSLSNKKAIKAGMQAGRQEKIALLLRCKRKKWQRQEK